MHSSALPATTQHAQTTNISSPIPIAAKMIAATYQPFISPSANAN
jgi:tRNA A37 threonylcarbamoyladenosine synthetase subunit TsaC/SUA5/YrdC